MKTDEKMIKNETKTIYETMTTWSNWWPKTWKWWDPCMTCDKNYTKTMARWWKLMRTMIKRDEQNIQKQWQNDEKWWKMMKNDE